MATNTAASFTNHTGNGTAGPFSISFSYLSEAEVDVTVGGVLKTITTHYTFTSATQITFTSGNEPGNGVAIKFQRDTNISAKKVDFQDGSVLTETDLDTNADQVLFAQQEIIDKLVGIEENATADQTNAEIRAAVEAATDSNVFTDADHSKLNAIEASATADQTAAEIRTLVESASDSNVFTDADHTKLNAIEASATADQTASEIRTLVESATDSNVFTDADHSKLNAIEAGATTDQTNAEIRAAVEAASDSNVFTDADHSKLNGIEASATADQTNAEIKTAYEANSDTNAFTDAEKTKLSGIETSADVTDATNVNAAGAVMNTDLGTKGQILVGDGSGDPTALSVGTNNHVLVADSSEATGVKWATVPAGSGMSNLVEDTTPQLGGNLDVNGQDIVSTSNADIDLDPNGTGKVVAKGNANRGSGQIKLNCEQNSHGVIIKGPPHSAAADYTLTLPNNDGDAGQFLKTDGSGGLSFDTVSQPDSDKITEGNTEAEVVDTGSDGHFKVTTEGTERLRVIADGKVGIGTTTPGELLQIYDASGNPTIHVRANNQNTASLKFENDDGNWTISSGTANYPLNFAVGGSNKLTILNDGKVGIGDTTPSTALEVNGTVTATAFAGSGANLTAVDAATVDGIDSASFLRSDATDSASGLLSLNGGIALTGKAAANITALSDGATITVDMATACHHSVTLGGNRTFAAPSNQAVGQAGSIFITQDGTGSRTAAFNSAFKFVGGTAPTLTTTAAAVDRIDYVILSSNVIHCAVSLDVK